MTQVEWQAERVRLAGEIEQVDVEWAAFRARGDWDGAQIAQKKFYALRTALATHDLSASNIMGADESVRDLTFAEWQSETARIASELTAVDVEWKILRDKGQWDIAHVAQERYHRLRKEQSTHALKMPKQ